MRNKKKIYFRINMSELNKIEFWLFFFLILEDLSTIKFKKKKSERECIE